MELWQFFGDLHPKLVQFPLVLLLLGLLFDSVGLMTRSARAHWAAMCLTILGTLGLLFAFICGIYAEVWAGRAGIPQHPIELHELMANIASWGFVILLAWRIFLRPQQRRRMTAYVSAGLAWYLLLALTAYLGGQLVFHYGAAVTGAQANTILTLSDLNTLATRQTDDNLRYSEWMHHIFGWMTLGLAASLLAQALWPRHAGKFKWIVPTFLLAGGIFLFFWADLDLYALTDARQWRDREVQLHKVIAIVMGTAGCLGMWRWARSGRKSDDNSRETKSESNSKLVAVLALIGGSLLFTHVHTVAPYANVAAGVYIAHVVLGLTALSIGATRLAQDYLPQRRRPLAIGFALFMTIESILLITYNEGLPWYIGYGTYNRWGPVKNASETVAPYGPVRALLRIDPANGIATIDVLDRYTEEPVAIAADQPLQLLIGRGYEETAIPLYPTLTGANPRRYAGTENMHDAVASHFQGHADFLKTTPALGARLALPLHGGRMVMGYFDPWVTPIIAAVPPNELALYQCPMHDGIRAVNPGPCPLCRMEMLPIRPPRPAGELHDSQYLLELAVGRSSIDLASGAQPGKQVQALVPAEIHFTPKRAAGDVVPLIIVHEQPLHLIVVSEDLTFFDHVHPLPQADGSLNLSYAFPRPGRYVLFADITPRGERAQVFRYLIEVSSERVRQITDQDPIHHALTLDPASSKLISPVAFPKTPQTSAPLDLSPPIIPLDAAALQEKSASTISVQLISQPRTIYAGLHTELLFRLTDAAGQPVTDLKPYLGAMGHCVAISEDTTLFLHSHPEQLHTPTADDRGGPMVAFHTLFPRPGRYRIWAQFRRGDQLVIAQFTVEASQSWVPPGLINFLLDD